MSEAIKHECGLAFIRLLQPIEYFQKKYGTSFYGLNKLYLLMEKQHNRGQDGAGIATMKLNVDSGYQFLHRLRAAGNGAIKEIFEEVNNELLDIEKSYPDIRQYPKLLKGYLRFLGEAMLGHLRYGTQGHNNINYCHPFIKPDIVPAKTIAMAGNFNIINTSELFEKLQLKRDNESDIDSDLAAMMEVITHFIAEDYATHKEEIDLVKILSKSSEYFDGGYVCGGLIGNGDAFVMRDKNGIRPAFYYHDDEVVIAASERPAIMTAFNVHINDIKELNAGHALIVKNNGQIKIERIADEAPLTPCSFERIYFSRGTDADIYKERMKLGKNLAEKVLKSVNYNLKNTIVSFIPNTAETAFYGLIKGMEDYLKDLVADRIVKKHNSYSDDDIKELIHRRVRIEKLTVKDVKMRTFITEDASRDEMVQHVYDITYGTVQPEEDTLVVIDDSIVRGTTLRESIIQMLARLDPKKIIIVSSAPQIRYPDCYGIDMSRMGDFVAFQAAISLLKERKMDNVIAEVYQDCINAYNHRTLKKKNYVKRIYEGFTDEEISAKISALIQPKNLKPELEIIFQDINGLHDACPNHKGDWYFTGNYPTPGGNQVANIAFINYIEKKSQRAY